MILGAKFFLSWLKFRLNGTSLRIESFAFTLENVLSPTVRIDWEGLCLVHWDSDKEVNERSVVNHQIHSVRDATFYASVASVREMAKDRMVDSSVFQSVSKSSL